MNTVHLEGSNIMDNKIKKSYEKIRISDEAKNRIQAAITMNNENNCEGEKFMRINKKWKLAAACLTIALIIPTGAYAAQKIYQYFTTSVSQNNYSVDMKVKKISTEKSDSKKPGKYIKVTADFGDDYILEKESDGELNGLDNQSAWASYSYKDGFYSGKCFWYEIQYMNGNKDKIISTYDVENNEKISVNGRKAVYCRYNGIVNSKYSKDHNTDYGQSIYIFAEDYGYIIEMAAQNGLAKDDFIKLAEKIQINKASSEKDASDYVLYSDSTKAEWNTSADNNSNQEINTKNYFTNDEAKVDKATVKITDVKILDSVAGLDKKSFNASGDYFEYNKIVDKNGRLNKYDREKIQYGDGVTSPKMTVCKTKSVQPKLVYVTAQFSDTSSPGNDGTYEVPSLQLISKENKKIYKYNDEYNRPDYIQNAFTDNMPCYFEETMGGKSFWQTKITQNSMTLHFAYLVDEDQIDGMALSLNNWAGSDENLIYLDISQK